jgi:hypothetical protein
MKTHTRIALALVASLMASTAWADQVVTTDNGTWTASPGQSTSYAAAVQQPINTDGSSKFKANGNAVIPVKFALSQGTGPFVFESTEEGYAFSFLTFRPNSTTLTFVDITGLSADYAFAYGDCHLGALRWQVRTSETQVLFIYYGNPSQFGNGGIGGCTPTSPGGVNQSGTNMIGQTDLRYDTSQYAGGTFYDTYAHALELLGTTPILRVSLVLDGVAGGNQVVTLSSATVAMGFTETFTPQPTSELTPVCPTSVATIGITKTSTSPSGDEMEPMTIQPRDNDGIFRIVDCKYMYNLATSSLMGTGDYNVSFTIDHNTFPVATFSLK